jgi:polysaccharide biosynthesis transport protein
MLSGPETQMYEADTFKTLLRNLLYVFRRRVWIIALSAVALSGVAVGLSFAQTPTYEASIKVLVGQKGGTDQPLSVTDLQLLTQTVVEAAATRPVADAVIQRLDLQTTPQTFLDNLDAEQVEATQFVELTYTDTDPEKARRVANTIGQVLSDRMTAIDTGDTTLTAGVWETAALPRDPASPAPVRNGIVALVAGVLLGAMLAFLLEYLDDTWRSPEEVEHISGKTNLGAIPRVGALEARPQGMGQRHEKPQGKTGGNVAGGLVTLIDPTSPPAEAYRTLRTNLFYSFVDEPPKAIVMTSASSREGKSFICANLGVVLAQVEKSTLIIDCDLRQPSVHKIFGVNNTFGVTDVVAGQRDWREVLHEPLPSLRVITAGTLPLDPANILSSQRFSELLAQVRQEFDYVLLDTAPMKIGPDAAIVSHQGDGTLLVVDKQNTRKWDLQRSMRSLQTVEAHVLGTIMNKVEPQEIPYYYGYNA